MSTSEPAPSEIAIPTAQILGMDGNPYQAAHMQAAQKPNPTYGSGAGGGGDPMIDIAGLKKNVGFLNWAGAALLAAGVAGFFMLDSRISEVGKDVVEVKVQGARQAAILEQIAGQLSDEHQSQTSARSEQSLPARREHESNPD